jgi:hypothetical protein
MSRLQIASVDEPISRRGLGVPAIQLLGRMEAMGLLPGSEAIPRLSTEVLEEAVTALLEAGAGREAAVAFLESMREDDPALMRQLLEALYASLEESPVPQRQWQHLLRVLGAELLARLVNVSGSSLRRYSAGERPTPSMVAARLHFLALIVGDLAGSYTEAGIRTWFERQRAQLKGRAPAELLAAEWDPADDQPLRVRELARALTALPGT